MEPNINLLFGIILDLKYDREIETRKLSKNISFEQPVKLNFGN